MRVNTKLLLTSTALLMGLAGLGLLFAPRELLGFVHAEAPPALTTIVQLYGILLVAFAIVNWTAKGSLIGGIYNRPIALGNLMHFAAGAMTLLKAVAGQSSGSVIAATAVYALFAIAFATIVFFQSPVTTPES